MRYPILIAALSVSIAAQGQPNCTGVTFDVDVRCACIKDPNGQVCAMVKAGFYDSGSRNKTRPSNPGAGGRDSDGTFKRTATPPVTPPATPPATPAAAPAVQPARPPAARVVPLAHQDYLRFLHPDAHLIAGFNFEKALQSPEVVANLFGSTDSPDARNRVMAALKEMDHLWLSYATSTDIVILMTGKFEQGVAAGMFYAQGIQPVFLGGAHAMMVGPEPSIQAALTRLAKPGADAGWVARRARELSPDHETWIVRDLPGTNPDAAALQPIRQFALGFRLAGAVGVDGEAVADSESNAEQIAAWVDQMKAKFRGTAGAGPLDSLTVERNGAALRFTAKDDVLAGETGKAAMNSDFGVALYSVLLAGFPGMPSSTVAADKLLAVKKGMKREEALGLLGQPLSVSSIQGLDIPRETWTYQVPFGKQFTMKLDGGVVTAPPR